MAGSWWGADTAAGASCLCTVLQQPKAGKQGSETEWQLDCPGLLFHAAGASELPSFGKETCGVWACGLQPELEQLSLILQSECLACLPTYCVGCDALCWAPGMIRAHKSSVLVIGQGCSVFTSKRSVFLFVFNGEGVWGFPLDVTSPGGQNTDVLDCPCIVGCWGAWLCPSRSSRGHCDCTDTHISCGPTLLLRPTLP